MKWILRAAIAGALIWLLWQGWQRLFVTDEMRIKQLITTMARAVEQNKILALANCIAGDYNDDRSLDKATLLGIVRGTRSQYDTMFIYISDTVVEIAGDRQKAQATLVARVLTKRAGGGSTELNAERIRLFFRKTDDGWKMTRVESPELKFE
jgi:ketosteroid isomerase-like protein